MTEQAAFHEGYKKALEEVTELVNGLPEVSQPELGDLLEQLDRMIERARCLSRSSLASGAAGDRGY